MGTHAKMTAEDYNYFAEFIGKKYTGRKKNMVVKLHAKYYHHDEYYPTGCDNNKCYKNWYKDLYRTYKNGKR